MYNIMYYVCIIYLHPKQNLSEVSDFIIRNSHMLSNNLCYLDLFNVILWPSCDRATASNDICGKFDMEMFVNLKSFRGCLKGVSKYMTSQISFINLKQSLSKKQSPTYQEETNTLTHFHSSCHRD